MKEENYLDIRNKIVKKRNDLIQRSRFSLSLQQQKIILYLISQITPYDKDFKEYSFDIQEFCKVCGIDHENGGNYELLKDQIKAICDKSVWITTENGEETIIRWIEKPFINQGNGTIRIKLDNLMMPYLLDLKENFTQYELVYTLHFKSKYTIRLYELIKSIHFHELESYKRKFSVSDLRRILDAEKYKTFQHFRDRVLEPAVREINENSDKIVSYEAIKDKRSFSYVVFTVKTKDIFEVVKLRDEIDKEMGIDPDQMTLFDEMKKYYGTDDI